MLILSSRPRAFPSVTAPPPARACVCVCVIWDGDGNDPTVFRPPSKGQACRPGPRPEHTFLKNADGTGRRSSAGSNEGCPAGVTGAVTSRPRRWLPLFLFVSPQVQTAIHLKEAGLCGIPSTRIL